MSRHHPSSRTGGIRRRTAYVLLGSGLVLAACGTTTTTPRTPDSSSPSVSSISSTSAPTSAGPSATTSGATSAPIQCSPPPPLPSQPASYSTPPPASDVAGKQLQATITTTCGDIVIDLMADKAPQTVSSFAFLAQSRFWEASPCDRLTVDGIWVLQCGDPTGTRQGGPGYSFGVENGPPTGMYPRGTVAMARASSPDSNGSQFFLVYRDTELPLDGGGYSIFGTVTQGMDILDHVAASGVPGGGIDGIPNQPISILSVEVREK